MMQHGKWVFDNNGITDKNNIYKTFTHIDCDNNSDNNNDNDDLDNMTKFTKTQTTNIGSLSLTENDLGDFRKAALIHKVARKKALKMLVVGGKISELVDCVEKTISSLCKDNNANANANAGIAFPVGVNINNVVAHDSKTVTVFDDREFCEGDVVKIDIGVHINGRIIDSAFTHIITKDAGVHDDKNIYNSVLEASRDSMFAAIKMCGPDQRLYEISESISEIIESYEVNLGDSINLPIKPVTGIGGHNIKQYQIHGGKLILSKPDYDTQGETKMEEDEIYAIETYATTGHGIMTQNSSMDKCTHYMEANHDDIEANKAITKKDKKFFRKTELYDWMKTRNGLPFSMSWIHKKIPKIEKALKLGIPSGQIIAYPPMYDEMNSVVAQFEHTVHVNDGSVEIFSFGDDY